MGCTQSNSLESEQVVVSNLVSEPSYDNERDSYLWNQYFDENDYDDGRKSLIIEDRYHDDVNQGYSGTDKRHINKSLRLSESHNSFSLPPSERSTIAAITHDSLLMFRSAQNCISKFDNIDGILDDDSIKELFRKLEEINKETHTAAIHAICSYKDTGSTARLSDDEFNSEEFIDTDLNDVTPPMPPSDPKNLITESSSSVRSMESAAVDYSPRTIGLSPEQSVDDEIDKYICSPNNVILNNLKSPSTTTSTLVANAQKLRTVDNHKGSIIFPSEQERSSISSINQTLADTVSLLKSINKTGSTVIRLNASQKNIDNFDQLRYKKLKLECPNLKVPYRKEPKTTSDVLGHYGNGQIIDVLENTVDGFFQLRGEKGDVVGYINKNTKGILWLEITESKLKS